ncbi:MAG: hypothetical protein K5888_09305 [Lachnospiraceae bacterium]|nr:hypothetical protein [Lachnospiraceae bacterium]
MEKTFERNYTEVCLDTEGFDRFYKNPLTKTFQNEYALYKAVSNLFGSVRCKSRCIETLRMYFLELPHQKDGSDESSEKKRDTQESLLEDMMKAVSNGVVGHVIFPMMNICTVNVKTKLNGDGTHTFLFTDGIYGFGVRLEPIRKGQTIKLHVTDLTKPKEPADLTKKTRAASKNAA